MIISHKYKFIFVKTRKTAGTSIEVFLSKVCGEEDIIAPLDMFLEKDHRDRNWNNQGVKFPETHMGVRGIKKRVPESIWNSYFKFCVERNPWDKVISQYYFFKHHPDHARQIKTFAQYMSYPDKLPVDYWRYMDFNNQVAVDRVLRYESLNQELDEVFGQLGIPFDGTLHEKAKGAYRADRRHYREVFTPRQAEIVRRHFVREIDLFGYIY